MKESQEKDIFKSALTSLLTILTLHVLFSTVRAEDGRLLKNAIQNVKTYTDSSMSSVFGGVMYTFYYAKQNSYTALRLTATANIRNNRAGYGSLCTRW